jgi:putative hydrolase of the HAD superfamily
MPALLFDLDDTLIIEDAAVVDAFALAGAHAASRAGVDAQRVAADARRIAREEWRAFDADGWGRRIGIASWEVMAWDFVPDRFPLLTRLAEDSPALRRRVWKRTLTENGIDNGVLAAEMEEIFRDRKRAVEPFPETLAVLNTLRGAHRMAIITNGAPTVQRGKIERAGLERFFDAIIISGEVGIGKPDPEIFHHALRAIDASASDAVMIGNSIERDIEGALGAGLRAVWVMIPKVEPRPALDSRVEVIGALHELPGVIGDR